jgi:hypothetical protein
MTPTQEGVPLLHFVLSGNAQQGGPRSGAATRTEDFAFSEVAPTKHRITQLRRSSGLADQDEGGLEVGQTPVVRIWVINRPVGGDTLHIDDHQSWKHAGQVPRISHHPRDSANGEFNGVATPKVTKFAAWAFVRDIHTALDNGNLIKKVNRVKSRVNIKKIFVRSENSRSTTDGNKTGVERLPLEK